MARRWSSSRPARRAGLDRTQPPEGAGAVRERWESLAALLSVAEDLARPSAADPGRPADAGRDLGRARPAGRGPARAGGPGRDGLDAALGQGPGVGRAWRCSACTRDRCRSCWPPPRSRSTEERRLLYVGMTRARRLLRISWSRTRNGGGNARKPSRFLDRVLPDLAAAQPAAAEPARARAGPGRGAVGALPFLRAAAERRRRAQARPPLGLPVDLRRGDPGPAPRVAPPGGGRGRACRRTACSPTPP